MTEVHGASAPTPEEVKKLLRKAEKGDKTILPTLQTWMDRIPGYWETVGDLAQTAQQSLIQTGMKGFERLCNLLRSSRGNRKRSLALC
jgi:hypothetical protein